MNCSLIIREPFFRSFRFFRCSVFIGSGLCDKRKALLKVTPLRLPRGGVKVAAKEASPRGGLVGVSGISARRFLQRQASFCYERLCVITSFDLFLVACCGVVPALPLEHREKPRLA